MVLAGLTPPDWEITIVDENLGVPDYQAMPRPDLVGINAFTSQANRAYQPEIFRQVQTNLHSIHCVANRPAGT
jgi:hypothetical protein